jgi:hypothetical protein
VFVLSERWFVHVAVSLEFFIERDVQSSSWACDRQWGCRVDKLGLYFNICGPFVLDKTEMLLG